MFGIFLVFTKFHEKCVWKLLKVSRKIYEKKIFGKIIFFNKDP